MTIRREWRYVIAVAMVLLAVLIALTIASQTVRSGLDDTASLAAWAVALGTLALAAGTFTLAQRAAEEAKAVTEDSRQIAEQVRLQREQMEQSVRAHVFPWVPRGWAMGEVDWQARRFWVLPLRNGGPGIALNVHGKAYWRNEGEGGSWRTVTILAGTIAASTDIEARLSQEIGWSWDGAGGHLTWIDLNELLWGVTFRYALEDGQLALTHTPPIRVNDLADFENRSRP